VTTPGRKPTPTALRVLKGNPNKRPLPADEPTPEAVRENVAPPEYLNPAGAAEWRRVAPLLAKNGLLSELDLDGLGVYCRAFADWRDATAKLEQFGTVIKAPSGYPIQSPYVSIAAKALAVMRAFMTEFGLTPASRTRVTRSTPKIEPSNPLDRFIRR
jgi:P27 family predicted phage terminase small subunit